jgi:hypothetical protein
VSASFARGARRRFVAVPAGTYPAPAPLAAVPAPRIDDDLFASPAEPASFVDPLFEESGISFAPAASAGEPPWESPPATPLEEESYDRLASSAFSTSEPEPLEEPAPRRLLVPGPTARGMLGILFGATIGALVGIALSTAMLALYAPTDFAQAILDPVVLWTEIEDWKVLAGAILIAIGFAVLGAGQGAQRRATRA